jgi:hypothetical protein
MVATDNSCFWLAALNYYHYLEAKKKQQDPDFYFIECFTKVIDHGRQKYLKKIVNWFDIKINSFREEDC